MKPDASKPIEQQTDAVLRRMLLYGEARNQPALGMLAILWVCLHRAQKANKGWADIILAPKQFSSFNADDPNRELLLTAADRDRPAWIKVDAVCELFEDGITTDPTNGATHYYNPKVVSPAWGRGHPGWVETAVIDDHVFGRAA